jgi:hypothetical protein
MDSDMSELLNLWKQQIEWKQNIIKSYESDEVKNEEMIEFHKTTLKRMKKTYEDLKKQASS